MQGGTHKERLEQARWYLDAAIEHCIIRQEFRAGVRTPHHRKLNQERTKRRRYDDSTRTTGTQRPDM